MCLRITSCCGCAFAQLLDHACKYSDAGTEISVSIQAEDETVTVRVWNGVSIPATEQVRIFDRFYRGIDARRQAAGSGLRLYVARKIGLPQWDPRPGAV